MLTILLFTAENAGKRITLHNSNYFHIDSKTYLHRFASGVWRVLYSSDSSQITWLKIVYVTLCSQVWVQQPILLFTLSISDKSDSHLSIKEKVSVLTEV